MAVSPRPSPQPPEFPFWPFNCLTLYTQVMRDFGGYAEAVTRSNDAMDTVRAEADFGAKLFADLAKGYYDLALAPWTAMAAAMAEQAQADVAPEAPVVKVQPRMSRARH